MSTRQKYLLNIMLLIFIICSFSWAQTYSITLNILNTPNENGQVVVIAGADIEVEFIIITDDDDNELSSNDIIRLVKLSTNYIRLYRHYCY